MDECISETLTGGSRAQPGLVFLTDSVTGGAVLSENYIMFMTILISKT